ncbi:hypothetical protein B0H16DRAFT_1472386 [Mycena metata]|uniref:Uncharacterized protein n=1 Tax=Mycena metata TaxID=1033252 RepID=A0AAD7MMQ7_9AGAR|nr:hypothetical protein B0H16DRAFT_1472386 [Mycena metata]
MIRQKDFQKSGARRFNLKEQSVLRLGLVKYFGLARLSCSLTFNFLRRSCTNPGIMYDANCPLGLLKTLTRGQEPATWPPSSLAPSMSLSNAEQLATVAKTWLESKPTSYFEPPPVLTLTLIIPTPGDPHFARQQAWGRKNLAAHLSPLLNSALVSGGLATPVALQYLTTTIVDDIEKIVDIPPAGFFALVVAVLSHDLQDEMQLGQWLDKLFGELVEVVAEEVKNIPTPVATTAPAGAPPLLAHWQRQQEGSSSSKTTKDV